MVRYLGFSLAFLLCASVVSAQTHRWHDLTPDSLRGATFSSVAVGYSGDMRVIYTSYSKESFSGTITYGVLKSIDSGDSWQHIPLRVQHIVTPLEHAHLVYALWVGALYKSTDGGQTWKDLTPALEATGQRLLDMTRLVISPHDTSRIVVAHSNAAAGLFLSEDGGETFRYEWLGLGSDGSNVNVVASPTVKGRLYVPVFRNGASISEDFFVFGDWGHTTEAVYKHPQVPVYDDPRGFKIDANEVLYSYEWVSRSGGEFWERTPDLGEYRYSVVATSPYSKAIYGFAGGLRHVSHDSGRSWLPLQDSLSVLGMDESIDPRDSTLFAGVRRSGIFAYARTGIVGTPVEEPIVPAPSIARAYPNPFRDEVTVEITTPNGTHLTAEVFDVLGRRVAVLAESAIPTGTLHLKWDGRSADRQLLGSGIYLVRIRSRVDETLYGTTLLVTKL